MQLSRSAPATGAGVESPPLVLVVMAVPEEAAGVAALVRRGSAPVRDARGRIVEAGIGGCRVRLEICGTGPRKAAAALAETLQRVRPAAVICSGLAGALRPDLRRGDLVVPVRVVERDGQGAWTCDARLLELAEAAARRTPVAPPSPGGDVLLTSPCIVGTALEKGRLASRATLVDMESAEVARAAEARDIPFLAVRVVSDEAGEDFPIDLNRYVDAQGNLQRARLAVAALCAPRGLGFLLGMRKAALEASRTLATFLEGFCLRLPVPSRS